MTPRAIHGRIGSDAARDVVAPQVSRRVQRAVTRPATPPPCAPLPREHLGEDLESASLVIDESRTVLARTGDDIVDLVRRDYEPLGKTSAVHRGVMRPGADVPADFTGRVRHFENGKPVFVAWYSEGLLHTPARHPPAYRLFRPDGRVKFEMYYTHGLLHDASPKHPAVKGFYANGAVHYEERYFGGKRNDGRDGSPAIRKWRLDGTLRHELRYREGKRLD